MVLMSLSSIVVEQTKVTEKIMVQCPQLLNYLSGHVDGKVQFHASNTVLIITWSSPIFRRQKPKAERVVIFHGVDATGWQAHLFKWSFSCQHHNFTFCCRLYCLPTTYIRCEHSQSL
jgi:hypothetical protein